MGASGSHDPWLSLGDFEDTARASRAELIARATTSYAAYARDHDYPDAKVLEHPHDPSESILWNRALACQDDYVAAKSRQVPGNADAGSLALRGALCTIALMDDRELGRWLDAYRHRFSSVLGNTTVTQVRLNDVAQLKMGDLGNSWLWKLFRDEDGDGSMPSPTLVATRLRRAAGDLVACEVCATPVEAARWLGQRVPFLMDTSHEAAIAVLKTLAELGHDAQPPAQDSEVVRRLLAAGREHELVESAWHSAALSVAAARTMAESLSRVTTIAASAKTTRARI